VRYGFVELSSATASGERERAISAHLTFYQSEFARWRAQYQYAEIPGEDDDRFFIQGTFAIGTHKHELQ
jgi:hypothetical protein